MPQESKAPNPLNILLFLLVLGLPVFYFVEYTPNTNESNPGLVWVVCLLAGIIGGALSGRGNWKWILTGFFISAIEAFLLAHCY